MSLDSISEDLEELPPGSSLIESVRNFGYNFNTAICDLVDNSITAGATGIIVHLEWNNSDPYVYILDNGQGMTEVDLAKNMSLGSKNPNDVREKNDLGRFGLGMKAASFSIARELNVFSKTTETEVSFRCWDLDLVEEKQKWLVRKKIPEWFSEFPANIDQTGTLIVWKKCDNLKKSAIKIETFRQMGKDLSTYLGTIFGRFIEKKQFSIVVNAEKVIPWLPIPPNCNPSSPEIVEGEVKIVPYVLPHHTKFEGTDYDFYAGIKGWVAQQGFYVYRNDRLIVNGSWLNLRDKKNDTHYSLARIVIDLPNRLDKLWNINVMKSHIIIPAVYRDKLESYAKRTRKEALEVAKFRAKSAGREFGSKSFVWEPKRSRSGKLTFEINKDHPILKLIKKNYNGKISDISNFIKLLEKSVPTSMIQIEENDGNIDKPKLDFSLSSVMELVEMALQFTDDIDKPRDMAIRDLVESEPFTTFKDEIFEKYMS